MKCKKCQTDLVEGQPFCPACGTDNRELWEQEPQEQETQQEPQEQQTQEQETGNAGPEIVDGKKLSPGKLAAIIAIVVVLLAVLVSVIAFGMQNAKNPGDETTAPNEAVDTVPADGNPDDETCKGTYTVTDQEAAAQNATVVATWGDEELTSGRLQIEYWMAVYNFLDYYGSYAYYYGLDYTKPLDVQLSPDGCTWQQLFLAQALDSWHQNQSLAVAAEASGFQLDAERLAELEEIASNLEETAAERGYENAEAMLQSEMGAGCTLKDYLEYLRVNYTGYYYYLQETEKLSVTEDEISAFFQEHKDEYAENGIDEQTKLYDVRHILLQPSETGDNSTWTEDEWEACRAAAQDLLDQWLAGEATEESFASLANEHSVDSDGEDGGLYSGLTEDTNFVEEFKQWYLDESRQAGDYGLVKTVYGYHIMYFSGTDEAWYVYSEADAMQEKKNQIILDAMDAYPLEVDYSAIVLGYVSLVSES